MATTNSDDEMTTVYVRKHVAPVKGEDRVGMVWRQVDTPVAPTRYPLPDPEEVTQ